MITFATTQQVHDAYFYYCMLYKALYADALQCSNTGTSADKAKKITNIPVKYKYGEIHCIVGEELSALHRQ